MTHLCQSGRVQLMPVCNRNGHIQAGQFDTQDATNGWGGELALYPGAAVRPRQIADRQGAAPLRNLPEGQFTLLGLSSR